MIEQRYQAGVDLWKAAKNYQQARPDLSDKQAFNLALLSNPVLAEVYTGFPVRRDGVAEVAKFLDQENETHKRETATERLTKIINRVPKLPDRTRDWPEVIRAVFQYPDTVEKAAQETMERLIKGLINEERIWFHPSEYEDVKRKLEVRLRAKHYDLGKTLDSPSNVNERALKLILNEQR